MFFLFLWIYFLATIEYFLPCTFNHLQVFPLRSQKEESVPILEFKGDVDEVSWCSNIDHTVIVHTCVLGQYLYAVLGSRLTISHSSHSADSESGNVRNSCSIHLQLDRGAGEAAVF